MWTDRFGRGQADRHSNFHPDNQPNKENMDVYAEKIRVYPMAISRHNVRMNRTEYYDSVDRAHQPHLERQHQFMLQQQRQQQQHQRQNGNGSRDNGASGWR